MDMPDIARRGAGVLERPPERPRFLDLKSAYRSRVSDVEEALSRIKSRDTVVVAVGACEPQGILARLHTLKDRVEGVEVYQCLPMQDYAFFANNDMEGHFRLNSWFHTAGVRKTVKDGSDVATYQPNHLPYAIDDLLSWRKVDVYLGSCTPPDASGHVSLSCSLPYEKEAIEAAETVILEVNDRLPRTYGDTHLRVDRVDLFYERSAPVPALQTPPPNEKDAVIGDYCADLIEDGSTLQIGIGGIPNACSLALIERGKRHLGVHSEMFTDSMVDLYHAGVIDNSRKTVKKDKFVATFALGTRKVYDFIHDNMAVEIQRGTWAIRPEVLAANYKMVSLNTCIFVDLTGQVCSESIGPQQYSGTGGQFCTHAGARQCGSGGRGILTCYSTGGKDGRQSSILPMLPLGSAVTTHRSTVDTVVTEYGVATLRGRDIRRRVKSLIEIAHPNHRHWLKDEARRLRYI